MNTLSNVVDNAITRLRKPSGRLRTTATIVEGENGLFLGTSRRNNYNSWGFSGGKSEEDEPIIVAACREFQEETGLRALDMDLIDVRDYDNKSVDPVSHDEVWLYKVLRYEGTIRSDEESIALGEGLVKWCTIEELIAGTFGDYNKAIFEELYGITF
jgi:8-oxo-dGTP pyrophosphatase MutT (NUDIX family)